MPPLSETMTNSNLQKMDIKDEELNSILDGLCKMFEEKHKRPPTEDEIKIWISQLKDASTDYKRRSGKIQFETHTQEHKSHHTRERTKEKRV